MKEMLPKQTMKNATVVKREQVTLFDEVMEAQLPSIHAGLHVPDAIREHGEFMGISLQEPEFDARRAPAQCNLLFLYCFLCTLLPDVVEIIYF